MNSHAADEPEDQDQDQDQESDGAIKRAEELTDDDGPRLSLEDLIGMERRIREGEPVSEEERAAYQEARDKMRGSMAAFRLKTSDIISPTTLGLLRSISDRHNAMNVNLTNALKPLTSVDWSAVTSLNFKVPTVNSAALLGIQNLFAETSEWQRVSETITSSALRSIELSFRRVDGHHQRGDEESSSTDVKFNADDEYRAEVERAEPDAEVIWEIDPAAYQEAGVERMWDTSEALNSLCTTAVIGNGLLREQIAQNNQTNAQLSALHDSFIGISSDLSAVKDDIRTSGKKTNQIAGATLFVAILTLLVTGATLLGL